MSENFSIFYLFFAVFWKIYFEFVERRCPKKTLGTTPIPKNKEIINESGCAKDFWLTPFENLISEERKKGFICCSQCGGSRLRAECILCVLSAFWKRWTHEAFFHRHHRTGACICIHNRPWLNQSPGCSRIHIDIAPANQFRIRGWLKSTQTRVTRTQRWGVGVGGGAWGDTRSLALPCFHLTFLSRAVPPLSAIFVSTFVAFYLSACE